MILKTKVLRPKCQILPCNGEDGTNLRLHWSGTKAQWQGAPWNLGHAYRWYSMHAWYICFVLLCFLRYDECENQNQTVNQYIKERVTQGGKRHVTGCPTLDQIRIRLILLIPHWPPPAMSAISNTKFFHTSLLLLVQLPSLSLHLECNVTMGSPLATRARAGKIIHSLYLSILALHYCTI